jgi:hypothetical protein
VESEAERLDRIQREFEQLRDCVNAELRVRTESSLLTLILLKVVLPFTAIAAGLTAMYISIVRAGETYTNRIELALALGYAVAAAGAIVLWRTMRKPGSGGRGDEFDQSMRRMFNLTVPPRKEQVTRNKLVNGWIVFWLTWGLIIGLPLIFFLFRADALERAGINLIFDTANVCAPTVGGYNPYEGSDVCARSGYTYTPRETATTSSSSAVGSDTGFDRLDVVPPRTTEEVNTAEIRLDVTTTLMLYFLILIGGIIVNMIRWSRRDKRRRREIARQAELDADRGTV